MLSRLCAAFGALALVALLVAAAPPERAALTVYDDALGDGWADWSWSATVDLASTSETYSGGHAVEAVIEAGWGGLYLQADAAFAAGLLGCGSRARHHLVTASPRPDGDLRRPHARLGGPATAHPEVRPRVPDPEVAGNDSIPAGRRCRGPRRPNP